MSWVVTVGVGYITVRTNPRYRDRLSEFDPPVYLTKMTVTFGDGNIHKCLPEPPTTNSSWLKEQHQ